MDDTEPFTVVTEQQIHEAVGNAISRYAQVEFALASILQNLLRIDFRKAHAIVFAIRNIRSQLDLFDTLLKYQFTNTVSKYWKSRSAYLQTLSSFRNAIAHRHSSPTMIVPAKGGRVKLEMKLSSHAADSGDPEIRLGDIQNFMADCSNIQRDLRELERIIKRRRKPRALPDRFLQPIPYRNKACLRQPQKPKGRGPRRPPSVPKLSAATRRKKALKDARLRAQKS